MRRSVLVMIALNLFPLACSQASHAPVKIAHGYQTDRVTATTRTNTAMGMFIAIDFPRDPAYADRTEIGDYLANYGGNIFEGGGYPGATVYATFDGVKTSAEADARMIQFLPGLDRLMADMASGRPVHVNKPERKFIDKKGKAWPECFPPDKDDPYGEFNNNVTVNGTPYKCSAEGRWVINQEAQQMLNEMEDQRRSLIAGLTTRKLSYEELTKVHASLNVEPMVPYYACEKYAELYDMLVKQWELQAQKPMDFYSPLSARRGEYGRCPQEEDNKRAVEKLIGTLQEMANPQKESEVNHGNN